MIQKFYFLFIFFFLTAHSQEILLKDFAVFNEESRVQMLCGLSRGILNNPHLIVPDHQECTTTLKSLFDQQIKEGLPALKNSYDPQYQRFDAFITETFLEKLADTANNSKWCINNKRLYFSAVGHMIQLHCNAKKIAKKLLEMDRSKEFSQMLVDALHQEEIGIAIIDRQNMLQGMIDFETENTCPYLERITQQ
ncbi:MAG: hypothetical protein K2X90_00965 [Candidatus Babeliaceae bacterium]|nr:hypothetical protein [Candidatus Babeliaceae bacterium]